MSWMKRSAILVTTAIFVAAGSLQGADLEGAGVGTKILVPLFRGEDGLSGAAKAAMKERDGILAGACLATFLDLSGDPSGPGAMSPILSFSKREGMFDRAAFLVALSEEFKEPQRAKLIEALTSSSSSGSDALAAATLAILYCQKYVSNPATFVCSRNDLKGRPSGEEEVEVTEETPAKGKGKGKGKGNSKSKKAGSVGQAPDIPEALFASRDGDAATLAVVAAAFSGDAKYKALVEKATGRNATMAGAKLLYLARQKDELPQATVGQLWQAATQSSMGASTEEEGMPFSAMLPGGCLACMGIAQLGDQKYLPVLVRALGSRDVRVQMDAVRAIRRLGGNDTTLSAQAKLLQQAQWPALVELCAALGAAPDKRVIPVLIKRLGQETGRFRLDVVHALSSIAGQQHGATAKDWTKWWTENQRTFTVDPAASKAYRASTRVQDVTVPNHGFFYGLPIYSDRLVYCVDSSASMKGDRIASLRENMVESLNSLEAEKDPAIFGFDAHVYFNIVDFGGDVVSMESGGLTDNFKEGRNRAETMPLTLGTRSFDAMERSMQLADMDTIYFLSDGAPVRGQIDAWSRVNASMDLMMLHAPVAIWGVAFDPSGGNEGAMKEMSSQNYGKYEAPAI